VGKCIKTVNGVWGEGGEPFKGRAFEGGGKSLAKDGIVRCIESNMGDVYFEMFIGVGFSRVAVQCEGLPLVGERCGCDDVNERVTTSGWL